MPSGSLTVVGTGIRLVGQVTLETLSCIERAQKLFYLVGDPVMEDWLRERNPNAESLLDFYDYGKPRVRTYREMVERILSEVRRGLDVTAAFYGHPGVFADPSHKAIRRARREGYRAVMLPGISAEDCLIADLGVDPGDWGSQHFEATYFLYWKPRFDTRSALILWQIGVIDEESIRRESNMVGFRKVVRMLQRHYPATHRVFVYEAKWYPVCEPTITKVPLRDLGSVHVPLAATLYVPPYRNGRGA
jgi:uncharacterized protein YabN with tetrapyrrole methylase and pyrophosphatase domain